MHFNVLFDPSERWRIYRQANVACNSQRFTLLLPIHVRNHAIDSYLLKLRINPTASRETERNRFLFNSHLMSREIQTN